ncbi:Protein of unknown function [Rhizobium sp. RU20A]|uniref:DUF2798 domain-containing protein n=1 Tax=Rhizobium sp. RU20A TaxID=1907412 RepID=UPI000953B387|nr:DUF2798 domain-containing protein [Rhizobium sp. RU20A]SIR16996.1 Protein of unknown function [Rhizobium sp. RU20A]
MPHQTSPAQAAPSSSRARRSARLHPRHLPWVFAFFMAAIMAMIMSTVIVGANTGVDAGLPGRILGAYGLAMPVAFLSVLAVRPVVMRLVALVIHQGQ